MEKKIKIPAKTINCFFDFFPLVPLWNNENKKELNKFKFWEASEKHKSSPNHKYLLSRKSTFLQVPEEEDSAGLAEDNFDNHVVPKTLQRRATRSVAAAKPFQVRKFVTDLWLIVNENFCLASDVKWLEQCYRWTKNQFDTMLFFGWTIAQWCLTTAAVDISLRIKNAWA